MRRAAVYVSLVVFAAGCTGQLTIPKGSPGAGGSDVGTGGSGAGMAGSDGTFGSGGRDGSGGAAGAASICTTQVKVEFTRRIADLLLLVGRNNSMSSQFGDMQGTTRMSAVQAGLHEIVMANQNAVNFGYLEFPSASSCASGVSCCADSPSSVITPSPFSFNAIAKALRCNETPCISDSDSRPIADAFASAGSVLSTSDSAAVILLTDGSPGCGFDDQCTAAKNQLAQRLSKIYVKTYVVTIGQDAEQSSCLKDIALQGNGNQSTYQARYPGQLANSLSQIVNGVARTACILDLQPVPPDPSKVSLKINDMEIPKDVTGQDGWKYTNPNSFSVIQVYGHWCQVLQDSNAKDVRVWSGCPP